jgi:hypothetical protein
MKKSEEEFRLSDLSNKSLRELYERFIETQDPSELEVLETEIQSRKEMAAKTWENIKKSINEFTRNVSETASSVLQATKLPFLLLHYEKEIQKVEQLLKYTKHSHKRRK